MSDLFGVIDIEAEVWTRFLVGGAWGEGEKDPRYFDSAEDLYNHIYNHKIRIWYAHNFGGYDAMFLLPMLCQEPDVIFTPQGDGASLLKVIVPGHLELRDSLRLLRAGLDKVGEALGYPKLKINYRRIGETYRKHPDRVLAYLHRDLKILMEGISQMRDVLGGALPVTLAGHGARSVKEAGYQPLTNRTIDHAIGEAYCGGRVEILSAHHKGEINTHDINSSYPRSWAGGLPGEYLSTTRTITPKTRFVRAVVTLPRDQWLPGLPVRLHGKLIFPVGTLSGVWAAHELDLATTGVKGASVQIIQAFNFAWSEIPARWARDLWKKRAAAKGFLRLALKWLGNETTGKLAERRDRLTFVRRGDRTLDGPGWIPFQGLAGNPHLIYMRHMASEPTLRHMAGAAWTTADARVRWYQAARRCQPIYGDTDSIKDVSGCFPADLTGEGLGEWKHESQAREGWYLLPKLYAEDLTWSRDKITGIKVKARGFARLPEGDDDDGGLNWQDFRRLARGGGVPVSGMRKFRSALRGEDLAPQIVRGEKRLRHAYDKRRVLPGGDTMPWTLEEACVNLHQVAFAGG